MRQRFLRYRRRVLRQRLKREAELFALSKSEKRLAGIYSEVDHYTPLLQVNHQRVSASISHISLMIAVLLFSYNYILNTPNSNNPNLMQLIIAGEVVLYLFLAVALIRCLRDFGLDKAYTLDHEGVKLYEKDFLEELAFRYLILNICNVLIRIVTIIFAFVLMGHFWRP